MNLLVLTNTKNTHIVKILAASSDMRVIDEAFHYAQDTIDADHMEYVNAIDLLKSFKPSASH